MLKRICDKCQSDIEVNTYNIPVPEELWATGGKGCKHLVYWGAEYQIGEIDLCKKCSEQLGSLIAKFRYSEVNDEHTTDS